MLDYIFDHIFIDYIFIADIFVILYLVFRGHRACFIRFVDILS